MITGDLKNRIDSLWTEFWTGGITNPLTVIEQITFLMYSRLLDMQERKDEKRSSVISGKPHLSRFGEGRPRTAAGKPGVTSGPSRCCLMFATGCSRTSVGLPERSTGAGSQFAAFMKDAQLMIQKPSLLVKTVNAVQDLPLERGDTQGRPLRVPAEQVDHGGYQWPVPYAAPHHPA